MSTKILITCPETGMSAWTGFRAPPGTGLEALKQVTLRKCPACGNAHSWDSGAAYWDESEAPPPSFWGNLRSMWRRSSPSRA